MSQTGQALLYDDSIGHSNLKVGHGGVRHMASTVIAFAFALLAAFGGLLAMSPGNQKAEAFDWGIPIFCPSDSLGYHMDSNGPWESILTRIPVSNKGNRTFTLQEALGGNVGFVNYDGAGKGTSWTKEFSDKDLKKTDGVKVDDTAKKKMEAVRKGQTCSFGSTMTATANGMMGATSFIAGIAQLTTTASFDPTFICKDAGDKGCIDVAKITGGDGSNKNGGIIGTLTNGLLIPLSTLMALITGIIIAIDTFRNRSYRQGLAYVGGLVLVYIIGVAFVTNPSFVARLPMQAGSLVTSSVLTPFVNATSGDDDSSTATDNEVCQAASGGASEDEQMSLTMSSLNCRIWKSFVLGPYSEASFGTSYENLDTSNATVKKALSSSGVSADDISVPLTSTSAPDDMSGSTLKLDGSTPQVKNLAAYQIYLQTDAAKSADTDKMNKTLDERWYHVIVPVAHDNHMWNTWSFGYSSYFRRLSYAFAALLASAIGTALITFTALLALVWLFISMIAICLLPIFLLMGLEQTRGRRILFKYLGELGTILVKYFISLMFVILTIVLFGAMLGAVDNVAMMLITTILLVLALLMFRGRILGMFGDANLMGMGHVKGAFSKAGRSAMAIAGGAAGSVMAERAFNPFKAAGAARRGGWDTFKRDLTRGDGFASNMVRQGNRISEDNKRDMRDRATAEREKGQDLQTDAAKLSSDVQAQDAKVGGIERERDQIQRNVDELSGNAEITQKSQEEILLQMEQAGDSSGFVDMQRMRNELQQLDTDIATGQITGNKSGDELAAMQQRRNELQQNLASRDQLEMPASVAAEQQRMAMDYNQRLSEAITGRGGHEFSPEDARKIVQFNSRLSDLTHEYNEQSAILNEMVDKHDAVSHEAQAHRAVADSLTDDMIAHRPGEFISNRKVRKAQENAETLMEDRATERSGEFSHASKKRVDASGANSENPLDEGISAIGSTIRGGGEDFRRGDRTPNFNTTPQMDLEDDLNTTQRLDVDGNDFNATQRLDDSAHSNHGGSGNVRSNSNKVDVMSPDSHSRDFGSTPPQSATTGDLRREGVRPSVVTPSGYNRAVSNNSSSNDSVKNLVDRGHATVTTSVAKKNVPRIPAREKMPDQKLGNPNKLIEKQQDGGGINIVDKRSHNRAEASKQALIDLGLNLGKDGGQGTKSP